MKISVRIILLVLGMIMLFMSSSYFLISRSLHNHLSHSQIEWVETLVQAIADSIIQDTINRNIEHITTTLQQISNNDEAIEYIYVTGFDGKLFAHSFAEQLPEQITKRLEQHNKPEIKLHTLADFNTSKGQLTEIELPLQENSLAHLHIGMNQDEINATLSSIDRELIYIILFIGIAGMLPALILGRGISKPIRLLTKQIEAYATGINPSSIPENINEPELQDMAKTFSHMVEIRTRTEAELKESEQKHRRMIENLGPEYFFYTHDVNGVFTYISPSINQVLGYTEDEFKVHIETYITDAPENRMVTEYTQGSIRGEQQPTYEVEIFHKNGHIHHLQVTESPVFDNNGRVTAVEGIAHDITAYKQQEKALRRSQKMDAIGQLSGGIAHDFNNQLGIVIGYLDILKECINNNTIHTKWVDNATDAVLRCTELTRQLLAFSRDQVQEQMAVCVNNSIDKMKIMIERSVTPQINVQYDLAGDLWTTMLNSGDFQDATLNLVINARDAMPKGGTLSIKTLNQQITQPDETTLPELQPGEYVKLIVEDTGTGMSKEIQERIFEPFFTTKEVGKGTGLGMSMVFGFVKRNNGHIGIFSEPGIKTRIQIYFPRFTGPATADSKNTNKIKTDTLAPAISKETILIVDDELELLQLANRFLQDLGYNTLTASNAENALTILQSNCNIDLLFTDIVMPGTMDGCELAKKALQIQPDIKVLLTSGFAPKYASTEKLSIPAFKLLNKPYRKSNLASHIQDVLTHNGSS